MKKKVLLSYRVNESKFALNYEAISALLTEACFHGRDVKKKKNFVGLSSARTPQR